MSYSNSTMLPKFPWAQRGREFGRVFSRKTVRWWKTGQVLLSHGCCWNMLEPRKVLKMQKSSMGPGNSSNAGKKWNFGAKLQKLSLFLGKPCIFPFIPKISKLKGRTSNPYTILEASNFPPNLPKEKFHHASSPLLLPNSTPGPHPTPMGLGQTKGTGSAKLPGKPPDGMAYRKIFPTATPLPVFKKTAP